MALDSNGVLNTYQGLVSAFTEFLTVAIHLILFERKVYPRESFLRTRKYDIPVQQNRHPKVCSWITDAVAAVGEEMLKTSVVLYSSNSIPLERYVFSTEHFPVVERSDILVPFESWDRSRQRRSPSHESRPTTPVPQPQAPIVFDIAAQFAAVLARISTRTAKLVPLPEECSFTVAIELRDSPGGRAPIDTQATWLPAEPGLQPATKAVSMNETEGQSELLGLEKRQHPRGKYLGGLTTVAIRSIDAGPFLMEVWIEEGKKDSSSDGRAVPSEVKSSTRPARHAHVEDAAEYDERQSKPTHTQ